MTSIHPVTPRGRLLCAAVADGMIDDADTAAVFVDRDDIERQIQRVRRSFPPDSVHSVAVKTNPLACVLEQFVDAGLYAEAASAEEMAVARAAGFGHHIVWDSPAKTEREITAAERPSPWLVNIDSLDELARHRRRSARLGLRVNPEVSPDTIAPLATGAPDSKFGVPLRRRTDIVAAFRSDPRLVALHVHSGSRMRSLDPMVEGVRRTVELADEINRVRSTDGVDARVTMIDIGGGIPATMSPSDDCSVERYAAELGRYVPALVDGTYRIVTEFGRFYHERAGWTATRVEYVKDGDDRSVAVVHVGADAFVREVYDPANWSLGIEVAARATASDQLAPNLGAHMWDIAGPLCFEGDVIARCCALGELEPGDWLIIEATGANTTSLWSRHCSRAFPKVLTYAGGLVGDGLRIGKEREKIDDVLAFWGYR